mmetsp:Transcript_71860/g.116537  ORF Transcript_71860/g.116537 Transcript_71860/m.116537 type:complete len:212 (-) Transcript_71860:64-699(-)
MDAHRESLALKLSLPVYKLEMAEHDSTSRARARTHLLPKRLVALKEKKLKMRAALFETLQDGLDSVHEVQHLAAAGRVEQAVDKCTRNERIAVDHEHLGSAKIAKEVAVDDLDRSVAVVQKLDCGRLAVVKLLALVVRVASTIFLIRVAVFFLGSAEQILIVLALGSWRRVRHGRHRCVAISHDVLWLRKLKSKKIRRRTLAPLLTLSTTV